MRTSKQLTRTHQCIHNVRANISQTLDTITIAAAQKEIIHRSLKGETIENIEGELDNILTSKNFTWENQVQKRQNLFLYKNRINRFLEFETIRQTYANHVFLPRTTDTTVDFFGETIKADADYFVRMPGNVTRVVRVHTGRAPKNRNETTEVQESYETYALGLLGKKLFPNDQIIVEHDYLADSYPQRERAGLLRAYDDPDYNKKIQLEFDDRTIEFFEQKHQQELENPVSCSASDCASCERNNICHFEEPPIANDVVTTVKPIGEIRLTNAQARVIDYEEGVARINAGAGAGKTLVVAMRIVELLKKGYAPEDICLLTFTNAGAQEMTARVVQYCAANGIIVDPETLTSTTFNAFCYKLVKEHYAELGYTKPPRVLPEETKSGIINRLLDRYPNLPEWNYTTTSKNQSKWSKNALATAKDIFTIIKKEGYTREENELSGYSPESLDLIFQMYNDFNDELKRRCMVEFDDQIAKVFELLEIHPNLFDEIGYKHIIVDEFQDTDLPQINLLNKIMDNAAFKSFMAVGDDSQAIFSFRHTSPEYMINFEQYFGRYDDFNLIENHRSTGNIIQLANTINTLNENRVEKDLIATKPDGLIPSVHGFYSQDQEYKWIAEQIKADIEAGKNYMDIAFLASTKNELTKMASILTEMGIPSILMNPIPYITNSRVAAITTLFDSFVNGTTRGLLDYKNVQLHGALKGASGEELESLAEEFRSEIMTNPKDAATFIAYAKALDPEAKDECYQSFLEKFAEDETLEEMIEFFKDFKLYGFDSCFKREGKYDGVCLTTVHSAKGLEWDTTYLSMSKFDNEKIHGSANRLTQKQQLEKEENNRKWFVGATRAREKLVMTGQYVLSINKNTCTLNNFVRQAYDMLGCAYTYAASEYWSVQESERTNSQNKYRGNLEQLRIEEAKGKKDPEKEAEAPKKTRVSRAKSLRVPKPQQTPVNRQVDFTDAEMEFI